MACKSFFCPAWDELNPRHKSILFDAIDDWHLYGLVVTDVDFVSSLFGLVETRLGRALDHEWLCSGPPLGLFKQMLSWKDSWPFGASSSLRTSRYYFKGSCQPGGNKLEAHLARLLGATRFGLGLRDETYGAEDFVLQTVEEFVRAYG
jgi:hypothetical protein